MTDELARRRQERNDDLEPREQLPTALRDAILEAGRILAAALQPGVKLTLSIDDQAEFGWHADDVVHAMIEAHTSGAGDNLPAVALPARLEAHVTVEAERQFFIPDLVTTGGVIGCADGKLLDRDGDGAFDEIFLVGFHVTHYRGL